MFSEALRIMDRNLERQMLAEMRAEANAKIASISAELQAARDEIRAAKDEARTAIDETKSAKDKARTAKNEAEIFRLRLLGRSADEITQELNLSPAAVQKVLSTLNE